MILSHSKAPEPQVVVEYPLKCPHHLDWVALAAVCRQHIGNTLAMCVSSVLAMCVGSELAVQQQHVASTWTV